MALMVSACEVHVQDGDTSPEKFRELLKTESFLKVYWNWIDPTCYYWQSGNDWGGYSRKLGKSKAETLEEIETDLKEYFGKPANRGRY